MTLLGLLQEFCGRQGLPVPDRVMTSRDEQLLQIVGLAHEVIEDLMTRFVWETLTKETTWLSTATVDQGLLSDLAPYGFLYIKDDTFFDRTQQTPVYGPDSPSTWQEKQALVTAGPVHTYRLRGGSLLVDPVMELGHTMAFEYASEAAILDADGVTYKKYFNLDTDVFLLNETLLLAGLRWKWKYEKGLRYSEDYRTYDTLANTHGARNGTKRTLSMNGVSEQFVKPAILVQAGSIS